MRVYSDVPPAEAMADSTADLTLVAMTAEYAPLLLTPLNGVLVTARGVVVLLAPPLAVVAVVEPTRMELESKDVTPVELVSLAA